MKRIKYGITFPINVSSEDNTLFDLNKTKAEKIKSEIMHLIFTPHGQRLRRPTFGTRLIQFIFNNTEESFGDVVSEIKEKVKMWIPECEIQDIEVIEEENGLNLFAKIKYTVREEDGSTGNYELISKL